MNYLKSISLSAFTVLFIVLIFSFRKESIRIKSSETINSDFLPVLSGYNLFKGKLSNLTPAKGTELYELTSHLFVDYAEKQRLMRLPMGTKMIGKGNGLPDFPDGTILVKTFYYYKDKRKPSLGKTILETRLLIKKKSLWKLGTYKWNPQQSEATLITSGTDVNVSGKNLTGENKNISFHIPSNMECSECHQSSDVDAPIGPKLRNMNFDVFRNGGTINQLEYFKNLGWLDSVNIASISTLPNWEKTTYTLENRARGYFDMNCAHCHNPGGSASKKKLFFEYETPFDSTGIQIKKNKILKRMQSDDKDIHMPSLGTTVLDVEGFDLIKQYINSIDKN